MVPRSSKWLSYPPIRSTNDFLEMRIVIKQKLPVEVALAESIFFTLVSCYNNETIRKPWLSLTVPAPASPSPSAGTPFPRPATGQMRAANSWNQPSPKTQ